MTQQTWTANPSKYFGEIQGGATMDLWVTTPSSSKTQDFSSIFFLYSSATYFLLDEGKRCNLTPGAENMLAQIDYTEDPTACASQCAITENCQYFTWFPSDGHCNLCDIYSAPGSSGNSYQLVIDGSDLDGIYAGNEAIDRAKQDTGSNMQFVSEYEISDSGTLVAWEAYSNRNADGVLQVFRHTGGYSYNLVGSTEVSLVVGYNQFDASIAVQSGDVLGWFVEGVQSIVFDNGGDTVRRSYGYQGDESSVDVSNHGNGWSRTYSIQATIHSTCGILFGQDIKAGTFVHASGSGQTAASDLACQHRCSETEGCTAWVTNSPVNSDTIKCWLHSGGSVEFEADAGRNAGYPCGPTKCSSSTCEELGWTDMTTKGHNGMVGVCGHSPGCDQTGVKWGAADAYCENLGARLCTVEEFQNEEVRGTGCYFDDNNVWTSDACPGGHYTMIGTGQGDPVCRSADEARTGGRCCADHVYSDTCLRDIWDNCLMDSLVDYCHTQSKSRHTPRFHNGQWRCFWSASDSEFANECVDASGVFISCPKGTGSRYTRHAPMMAVIAEHKDCDIDIVRAPEYDGLKCPYGSADRTFALSGATTDQCQETCVQDAECVYVSRQSDGWCAGCKVPPSQGAWGTTLAYRIIRGRRNLNEANSASKNHRTAVQKEIKPISRLLTKN